MGYFLGSFFGGYFGQFWAILGHFWGDFGQFLGTSGAILGDFGQFWAILGNFLGVALFRYRSIRALAPAMCSFHCAHTPPQVGYVLVSLRAYAAHRSRGGVLPFEDRNCRPISFGAKSFDRRFAKP